MKVKFYHWYNAVLSALLTMLGFGACTNDGEDAPVEYGTPYSDYIVKGFAPYAYGLDSTVTDEQGKFLMKARAFIDRPNIKLIMEDTDGSAGGGEFLSDTLALEDLPKQQKEPGQHWSSGTFELNANVKMKKKP